MLACFKFSSCSYSLKDLLTCFQRKRVGIIFTLPALCKDTFKSELSIIICESFFVFAAQCVCAEWIVAFKYCKQGHILTPYQNWFRYGNHWIDTLNAEQTRKVQSWMSTQIHFFFMHAFIIYYNLFFFHFHNTNKNNATGSPVIYKLPHVITWNIPNVITHPSEKVLSCFSRLKVCLESFGAIKCCTVRNISFTLTHSPALARSHTQMLNKVNKLHSKCILISLYNFFCLYILTGEIIFLSVFCPESVHHIHKCIWQKFKTFFQGIF